MREVNKPSEKPVSQYMKALEQSMTINNFSTNSQFMRDLGLELIKGSDMSEHIEALNKSMDGVVDFIELLNEKLKEKKAV